MKKNIFLYNLILISSISLFILTPSLQAIEAGAVLDIKVSDESYLDVSITVSEEGTINYRNIQTFNVKGLSLEDISRKIENILTIHYSFIDDPQVSVQLIKKSIPKEVSQTRNSPVTSRTPNNNSFEYLDENLRPSYQISPHDILEVSVFGEDELEKTVRVSEQGNIAFPLIGNVKVAGLSVEDAVVKIEGLLKEGYLVNPQVNILITEYSKFSVLGEVNRPGTFELKGALTLVDAIVLAEGPKDSADLNKVKVIRVSQDETNEIKEYFLDFEGEGRSFYLKPQDRIVIEPKGKIYILGAVNSPGMYYFTEKELSLNDAISFLAGGLNENSDSTSIEVIRKENGVDKTYKINLEKEGYNFLLKEQDRIVVSEYGNISIFGQVQSPGRYPFKEGITAVDAIALAGGFTDVAARNSVKVIRKETGRDSAIKIPAGYILKTGDTSRDVELKDGDTIVIPESWF